MLEKQQKLEVMKKFGSHPTDTGSPEVQIALLSSQINSLSDHFKMHKKDNHSRHGLLRMVSQRRKLLNYLQREDESAYEKLIKALKIKRRAANTLMPSELIEEAVAEAESLAEDGVVEEAVE